VQFVGIFIPLAAKLDSTHNKMRKRFMVDFLCKRRPFALALVFERGLSRFDICSVNSRQLDSTVYRLSSRLLQIQSKS
jgi:hypothetical protein